VADSGNNTIRKIVVATGEVTTLAGLAGSSGNADGIGSAARFSGASGVASDGFGNLYVADTGNCTIRKIVLATGDVSTLAGLAGSYGNTDGAASAARFWAPEGITADGSGNIYVAEFSSDIRKIVVATAQVTTPAGLYSGFADGTGSAAQFFFPDGLAADSSGNVFVADTGNNTIRIMVVATGEVTTLAGGGGNADGVGSAAQFSQPAGVAADGSGNLYVADDENNMIRKIDLATREVTTLAGLSGMWNWGGQDGIGREARFNRPTGVAADRSGNVYVADYYGGTIRRIVVATGEVTTLAGIYLRNGSADGTGSAARFQFPKDVAADGSGNLYVADVGNNAIRKIVAATGKVSTLAGLAGHSGSADGFGSVARFNSPEGIAADDSGNVYVADRVNSTIRKIVAATGEVTTLAGLAESRGSADGIGGAARFNWPTGVAADSLGNVYVADTSNSTIRKIVVATGEVTTVAGLTEWLGDVDGTGSQARFAQPSGVAADDSGNVFIADTSNNCIRKGTVGVHLADVATIDSSTGYTGQVRQLDTSPQVATKWLWQMIRRPAASIATLSSTTIRNPTFTPDAPDLYVFRLTASDSSGAQNVTTVSLTATESAVSITADFTWSASPKAGQMIQFTDTSTGSPTLWSWDFGDGFSSTLQSPTHAFATAGAFVVTLTVSNGGGSNTTAKTVTVASAGASSCVEDAATMCLLGGRYRIASHWRNQYVGGAVSTLSKATLTDVTGAFWLFDPATYEYLIRINTATNNGRAWIAIPTFTDVEFWIDVTDTVTGQSKEYHSAPGNRTLVYDPYFFVFP
jgi:PKD repeat protein